MPDQMSPDDAAHRAPVAVLFITLNEEKRLPEALESIKDWAAEIWVVDSGSTDRTQEIARAYGASVVERPFTGFGAQWDFAARELPIAAPWSLKLDPDERPNPELLANLRQVTDRSDLAGVYLHRHLHFLGGPIDVRQRILRMWRTGACRFEHVLVNEYPIVDGPTTTVEGVLEHLDSPTLHDWFAKQNQYSTAEAERIHRSLSMASQPSLFGNRLARRMWLKSKLTLPIPFKYQALNAYYLFSTGAFRSGWRGYQWAHLRTELHRALDLKVDELRREALQPSNLVEL